MIVSNHQPFKIPTSYDRSSLGTSLEYSLHSYDHIYGNLSVLLYELSDRKYRYQLES